MRGDVGVGRQSPVMFACGIVWYGRYNICTIPIYVSRQDPFFASVPATRIDTILYDIVQYLKNKNVAKTLILFNII